MAENICSQCGASNSLQAKFCGSCGSPITPLWSPPQLEQIGPSPQKPAGSGGTSGKAIAALILGILSIVSCCGPFTGIPGAILGKMEMDAIKKGLSPESNLGMAKAGFWTGAIGTVLTILFVLLAILFGFLSSLPLLFQ